MEIWRRYRRRLVGAALAGALAWLGAAPAQAQRIIVSDLRGNEQAGALTLLLRSMLRQGQRPAVGVQEMRLAMQRIPAARQIGSFGVVPAEAEALMKDLGADRVLLGELTGVEDLALTLRVVGPGGATLAKTTVQSPHGDLSTLALAAANAVAKQAGFDVQAVEASLGELRPFARASAALAGGNLKGAAEDLQLASRGVARRVPAAKEVADVLWRLAELPTDLRIVAALAAGESEQALKLGRADTTSNPEVLAAEARASLDARDLKGARKALAAIGNVRTESTQLARAELDLQTNKKSAAAKALTPLLKKDPPSSRALSLIAQLPPGALGQKTEMLVLSSARGQLGTEPGLVSAIGMRAVRGGNKSAAAVGLLKPDEMRPMDLSDVDKLFEEERGGSPPAVAAMVNEVRQRRTAKVIELKAQEKKKPKKVITPPHVTPEIHALAVALGPMLNAFPQVAENQSGTVMIYPIASRSPWWALHWVNPGPIGFALEYALATPPHKLGAILTFEAHKQPLGSADFERLANTGKGEQADMVLLYRCSSRGGQLRVELQLYQVAEGKLAIFEDVVEVSSAVVRLNPFILPLAALLLIGLFGLGYLKLVRVGAVVVEIKRDPGAEREVFAVCISKKGEPPAIVDPQKFHTSTTVRQGRRYRLNAGVKSEFPRIPAGEYWVHVYGTFEKGGELREIPAGTRQRVAVKWGEEHKIFFDLDSNTTEYRFCVLDGAPVAGARLRLNGGAVIETDRAGMAVMHLPKGLHRLEIVVGEERFEKRLEVNSRKLQVVNLDLVAERRDLEHAKGIALSHSEHPGAAARPAPRVAVAVAAESAVAAVAPAAAVPARQAAPPPSQPPADDDGVSLPAISAGVSVAAMATPEDDQIALPPGFSMPDLSALFEGETDSRPSAAPSPTENSAPPPAASPVASAPPSVALSVESAPPSAVPPVASAASGRYRRLVELGRGSAGVVWKGRDTVADREVAIKVLTVALQRQGLEAFVRERDAVIGLDHPNLVPVFDRGVDADGPFQVSEFVAGPTLAAVLRERGAVPMDELVSVADQLLAAVDYMQQRRRVHGRIKPANLFVADGVLKLADLGLGAPPNGAASDLHAVGHTLFELACGRAHPGGEVKPSKLNAELHTGFDALVLACLRPEASGCPSVDELRGLVRPLKAIYG